MSAIGALLLAVGVGSVLIDLRLEGEELALISALVVGCLGLVGLGAHLAVAYDEGREHALDVAWMSVGVLGLASFGAWFQVVATLQHTPFESALFLPPVAADYLLYQAIYEVFENATVHGGDAPTVRVAAAANGEVVVTVADGGPGVAVTPAEKLFEPSERGPHSERDGLGLFLASTILDRYGGTIELLAAGSDERAVRPAADPKQGATVEAPGSLAPAVRRVTRRRRCGSRAPDSAGTRPVGH